MRAQGQWQDCEWNEAWPEVREMIAVVLDEPVLWLRELKAHLLQRN